MFTIFEIIYPQILRGLCCSSAITMLSSISQQVFVIFCNYFSIIFIICCIFPSAPHVGECIAQLIDRILETGQNDIHLIGFSLGAQVSNYVANKLKPNFIIPRISGLGN